MTACTPIINENFGKSSTPTASRTVVSTTLPLQEKWRKSNIYIENVTGVFFSNGNQLIFSDHDANNDLNWMTVLNSSNGSQLWKTKPEQYIVGTSIAVDNKRWYVSFGSTIRAYDLFTGNLLWEVTGLPMRTFHQMYVQADKLIVYSAEYYDTESTVQVVRVYDPQTGMLENNIEKAPSKSGSYILKTGSMDYWADRESVWAVENETGLDAWSVSTDEPIYGTPLLLDGEFIFASGLFSNVIALNNTTGEQIWKYDKKIVSNVAAESGVIYVIREDAALVAINAYTGKEIGHVIMMPSFTEPKDSRSIPYYVTVANHIVHVYFGDSHEIIAFQIK